MVFALIGWTIILVSMYSWGLKAERDHYEHLVELKASALADQTQVLRRWIGGHGGVYAEVGGDIEPNPDLAHIPERDVTTPSGRELTLLNSPTVLRRILTEFESGSVDKIRLVAYNPINPDGMPDAWEHGSLDALGDGKKYIQETVDEKGQRRFRLMYPIKSQPKCSRCHDFGEEVNKVIGGLSISIDRRESDHDFAILSGRLRYAYLGVWSAGVLGWIVFYFVSFRLIQKLNHSATHDHLTQLFNRGTIEQHLQHGLKIADRYDQPYSILLLDIDFFKQVNDTYGHAVGDKVLQEVTTVLQSSIRTCDTAGRLGGEEFLVLAPNTDVKEALTIVNRILEAYRTCSVQVDANISVPITVSVGLTSWEKSESASDMMQRADRALYKAKNDGRNQACVM